MSPSLMYHYICHTRSRELSNKQKIKLLYGDCITKNCCIGFNIFL